MSDLETCIRGAWQGRISGCMLGKPVEMMSMREGYDRLEGYLNNVDATPLRDYIPLDESEPLVNIFRGCCKDLMTRSEPDDDVHYSVLALMMLEKFGRDLSTQDVARSWLNHLPVASTYTAERAAYRILLQKGAEWFPEGGEPGFDLAECADNPYNDWIGAQIRADVYGWVCPGDPELGADLARRDAQLSHREDGVYGAMYVAAMGALIPGASDMRSVAEEAKAFIPKESGATNAIDLGLSLVGNDEGGRLIREHYKGLPPVHTLNNLALVIWALVSHPDDFSAAIGDVVEAGLDTDCNGATVGGLWGLQAKPIPDHWIASWQGRVGVNLAGQSELKLDDLVSRTIKVSSSIKAPA